MTHVDHDGLPLPQRYGAILTIVLSVSIAVLDGAIANVAFLLSPGSFTAVQRPRFGSVNAYQLAIIVSLLSFASLDDIYGYRRVYQCGQAVFSVMSLLCALSDSLWMLIGARVLQGLGATAVMSINGALIRIIYPQRILGGGMAINTLMVAVSTAAGPTVAAGVLSVASWQWLFTNNVPIGLFALWLRQRYLPVNPQKNGNAFK